MECKVKGDLIPIDFIDIGIYPEWNVKQLTLFSSHLGSYIGIYPEWNVKLSCSQGAQFP